MKIGTIAGAVATGAAIATTAGLASAPAEAAPRPAPAPAATAGTGNPATRGEDCTFFCSEIENFSGRSVRIGRDWCGPGGNGTVKKGTTACDGYSGDHPERWLKNGEHSGWDGYFNDTDTFGIIAGCTMKVQWNKDGSEGGDFKTYKAVNYNRWVKVGGDYDIDIESYKC